MKINNIGLIAMNNTLLKYAEKYLPQKISYAITKNSILIEKELAPYFQQLQKIIQNYEPYQVKDSDGEVVNLPTGIPKVDDEHMADYTQEIESLLRIDTEIELYNISDEVFDYGDNDRYDLLSAADIFALREILCDESQ